MKEITLDTKIADLLNNYDGMKEILIDINPKFKKLNNPILRRTIAKVAGVRQAAIVGGMKPMDLLNKLREAVGQEPLVVDDNTQEISQKRPEWIDGTPKVTLDANEILDKELNPLVELHKAIKSLQKGDIVLIKSDFRPEPLIEEYIKKGHEVYSEEINKDEFETYILV
jgi:TusA-related sulfurtransferase